MSRASTSERAPNTGWTTIRRPSSGANALRSNDIVQATHRTDGKGSFRSHYGNGLFRNITYTATTVKLQNLLASEGDTDGDQDVDTADLTGMIINFNGASGSGATWLTGDTDGDGDTDTADLTTGIINFTGAMNTAVAVPEPSCTVFLVMAIGCLSAVGAIDRCREF